jgi:hypothetical protein
MALGGLEAKDDSRLDAQAREANVIETIIAVIVIIFIVLAVLTRAINSMSKTAQKFKGHNRCEACRSRLKAVNGQYALTCRRCGHQQSWAVRPASAPQSKPSQKTIDRSLAAANVARIERCLPFLPPADQPGFAKLRDNLNGFLATGKPSTDVPLAAFQACDAALSKIDAGITKSA